MDLKEAGQWIFNKNKKGELETLVSSTNAHHNVLSLQCPVINYYILKKKMPSFLAIR